MFSGGDYEEVGRWLMNFANAHAKRENPRAEALVETGKAREGKSYGVRVSLGERLSPPADQPPIELTYPEVAAGRGSLTWCDGLAARMRSLVQRLTEAGQGAGRTA